MNPMMAKADHIRKASPHVLVAQQNNIINSMYGRAGESVYGSGAGSVYGGTAASVMPLQMQNQQVMQYPQLQISMQPARLQQQMGNTPPILVINNG